MKTKSNTIENDISISPINVLFADTCSVTSPFSHKNVRCSKEWSWEGQDLATYDKGWTVPPDSFSPPINSPYVYRDWAETDGIPHVGAINVYPAGRLTYVQNRFPFHCCKQNDTHV